MRDDLPLSATHEVRDRCLCLHVQRAARALARRFDAVLKPYGLSHGQFSLLVALNRPGAPKLGELADFLAMDRTTMTAALKVVERRGLVAVQSDPDDGRSRRLHLTEAGRDAIAAALPAWRAAHDALDADLSSPDPAGLRADLLALGAGGRPPRA